MKIAVDLDATITAYPMFFSLLTDALAKAGHEIYIITDRPPDTEDSVQALLEDCDITWHHIKITSDKEHYILSEGIEAIFDDSDVYFQYLPENIAVFKIRQHHNFDFSTGQWLYTNQTGREVHAI